MLGIQQWLADVGGPPWCSGWHHGIVVSGVRHINEVNPRQTRLVPGWVTIFGQLYHLSM